MEVVVGVSVLGFGGDTWWRKHTHDKLCDGWVCFVCMQKTKNKKSFSSLHTILSCG